MAQVAGNIVSPMQSALNNKQAPSPFMFSKPTVSPIGLFKAPSSQSAGMSVAPAQTAAPKVAAPIKTAPVTAAPVHSASSAGSYNGVAITPGTDTDVAAQIARIDASKNPSQAQSAPLASFAIPSLNPQSNPNPSPAPVTQPTSNYQGLVGNLIQNANQQSQAGQMTPDELAARQSLAQIPGIEGGINQSFAQWQAGNAEQPIPVEFQQGRAQVEQNLQANRLAAVGQHEQALSQGVSALAAQRQASQQAYQGAETPLNAAVTAAQPQLGQYGSTYYSPLEAGQGGQGGVNPSDSFYGTLQQYAHLLANNQGDAIPSSITSNPVLNAQVLQMAQQINPNFNYNTAQGAASAQQANTAAAGTAVTSANASGLADSIKSYNSLNTAVTGATNLGKLLVDTMGKGGINAANSTDFNRAGNIFKSRLSSPDYAQFISTLNSTRNAYQAILTSGGQTTPTSADASLISTLDANSSPAAIAAALTQLNNEAYSGKLQPLYSQLQNYQNGLGGSNTAPNNNGAGSTGTKASAGGFNFVQDASGKWVPA